MTLIELVQRADTAWKNKQFSLAHFFYEKVAMGFDESALARLGPQQRSDMNYRMKAYRNSRDLTERAYDAFYYYQDLPAAEELVEKADGMARLPRLAKLFEKVQQWKKVFIDFDGALTQGDWETVEREGRAIVEYFPANDRVRYALDLGSDVQRLNQFGLEVRDRHEKDADKVAEFDETTVKEVLKSCMKGRAILSEVDPRSREIERRSVQYADVISGPYSSLLDFLDMLEGNVLAGLFQRIRLDVSEMHFDWAQARLSGSKEGERGGRGAAKLYAEARITCPPLTAEQREQLTDSLQGLKAMLDSANALDIFRKSSQLGEEEAKRWEGFPQSDDVEGATVDVLAYYADRAMRAAKILLHTAGTKVKAREWEEALELAKPLTAFFAIDAPGIPKGLEGLTYTTLGEFGRSLKKHAADARELKKNIENLNEDKKYGDARKELASGKASLLLTPKWRKVQSTLIAARLKRRLMIYVAAGILLGLLVSGLSFILLPVY